MISVIYVVTYHWNLQELAFENDAAECLQTSHFGIVNIITAQRIRSDLDCPIIQLNRSDQPRLSHDSTESGLTNLDCPMTPTKEWCIERDWGGGGLNGIVR